jgi:RNA-directed DNA polymerase
VTRLLTTKLKLRVNSEKSAVARPWERKFLGFSFTNHKPPKRRLAPKTVVRFKERAREITRRTRGISLVRMVHDLAEYLRGWIGYFRRCETPSVLEELGKWLRRRLRSMVWKQWKRGTTRYRELRKRGVAAQEAGANCGQLRWTVAPRAHPSAEHRSVQRLPRLAWASRAYCSWLA